MSLRATGFGSNQDPDEWRDQAVDRERQEQETMSEQSKIQWTDSTGGPWLVCSEVSPGCAHCYARDLAETRLAPIIRKSYRAAGFADWETRPVWGDKAPRVLSKGFWNDIVTFNNKPWVCEHGRAFASQTDCQHESLRLPGQACQCHRRRCFPSLIDWLDEMPAGILDQDGNLHDPILVLGREEGLFDGLFMLSVQDINGVCAHFGHTLSLRGFLYL